MKTKELSFARVQKSAEEYEKKRVAKKKSDEWRVVSGERAKERGPPTPRHCCMVIKTKDLQIGQFVID